MNLIETLIYAVLPIIAIFCAGVALYALRRAVAEIDEREKNKHIGGFQAYLMLAILFGILSLTSFYPQYLNVFVGMEPGVLGMIMVGALLALAIVMILIIDGLVSDEDEKEPVFGSLMSALNQKSRKDNRDKKRPATG